MKCAPFENLTSDKTLDCDLTTGTWESKSLKGKIKKMIVFVGMDYFFSRKRLIAVTTANTNVRTPKNG